MAAETTSHMNTNSYTQYLVNRLPFTNDNGYSKLQDFDDENSIDQVDMAPFRLRTATVPPVEPLCKLPGKKSKSFSCFETFQDQSIGGDSNNNENENFEDVFVKQQKKSLFPNIFSKKFYKPSPNGKSKIKTQ